MWTLILIGVLGGLVTGVSPCVLPMLPIIFFASGTESTPARPDREPPKVDLDLARPPPTSVAAPPRRWRSSTRPALIVSGLILSFSVFALIGSLLLTALGLPQDFLRGAGLLALLVVGASLIFPQVEELLQRPFRRLPRICGAGRGNAFVLGLGLGTLYVPCAGPVLAAITIAGASGSITGGVVVLTVAFAIGMAVPLFCFALAGRGIGRRVARYRPRARRFRVAGGVVMMVLAVALAFNLTDRLQRALPDYTQALQERVQANPAALDALADLEPSSSSPAPSSAPAGSGSAQPSSPSQECTSGAPVLTNCGPAPAIRGVNRWFNTQDGVALSLDGLRGKVVLVEFWAFSCINCQRALPHVKQWDAAYRSAGLQVIGIHTPEFAFEREPDNVAASIDDMGITYPVALDNLAQTWTGYHNRWWPAMYLIDATGTIRHLQIGEGGYGITERLIRELLVSATPSVRLAAPLEPAG